MERYFLEMKDIKKQFSSNIVLNGVNLCVKHGEVHALMGENGAGKSTLMKILMGIHPKDGGQVFINGRECDFHNPKQAIEHGVSMIHQELNPILDMMVCENIYVGNEPYKTVLGIKMVDEKLMAQNTANLLKDIGIDISPYEKMRNLSIAQTQLIEIVKAISQNAKIIIMDEPTSALTEKEAKVLFAQIRKLKESGIAIIYISHKLEEIFEICDAITVMRDGLYIDRLETAKTSRDELIAKMVGREILEIYPKSDATIGEPVLEVKNLSYKNKVRDISFELKRGEILGIAGLVGSGRSETASAIFGVFEKSGGQILLNGKEVEINKPLDAIKHKIAYITEDRKVTGLNLIESIRHNITIVAIKDLTKNTLLNRKNEVTISKKYIDMLKIKTTSHEKVVKLLSGGNQQKVAIAKWLVTDPDIIILDEPTRGIDVGAKRDIYLLMCELAKQGKSIIMISSEMPEVMGMSDRILVFAEGKIAGEVLRKDFDEQKIMNMQFV